MTGLRFALAVTLAGASTLGLAWRCFSAEGVPQSNSLVVHEWGTFTSVAGADGQPLDWLTLSGPADLPCFVNHLNGMNFKAAWGKVRMETPVLYFYSPVHTAASVHVEFPQGLISEWYPRAQRVLPSAAGFNASLGKIDWNVEIAPGETAELPAGKSPSHYYAARETDAALLKTGSEREKMLFYRGMGSPDVWVAPRFTQDGKLEIRSRAGQAIPVAFLFENRGGRVAYRSLRNLEGSVKVDAPDWYDLNGLRTELAAALVDAGLYQKEAQAMIATWHDSWFEEGMRVFYIVPRHAVDATLPLRVTPAPKATERVFVGRVEILSPYAQEKLTAAAMSGDVATLRKYGRFVDAYMRVIPEAQVAPAARQFLDAAYEQEQREFQHASCSQ